MTVGGPSAPVSEDPLLNRVLSDRYRILSKLGEGGMGVVYLAEHVLIEKKIALKVLFPDLTRRSDLVQRFMQEAKSASRIGHENVIDITDFGQSPEGYVFIAMEYLVGQDLGQALKASGPMAWRRAQPIVLQIVKALSAAHERGIVHRDMKPENVFVLPRDDGREFVKVLDFGIAKVLGLDEDAPRLTRTGMIFGTPEYMSPEQAQGQQVDHRVDIYAVGCLMYHMLTGEVPFKAESFMGILSKHMLEEPIPAATRNPAISAPVEAVIKRAMEKNPEKRFQTMREFVDALVPLGYLSDRSAALALSTGLPAAPSVAPGTQTNASPPLETSAVATSLPASGARPNSQSGPVEPLPHSTKQMQGRANTPLASTNPEARRSSTEIFSHDDERPPHRKVVRSGGTVVMAAGAGVVLLAVIVFFVLRSPGAGSDAQRGGNVRTTPAAGSVLPGTPPAAPPSSGAPTTPPASAPGGAVPPAIAGAPRAPGPGDQSASASSSAARKIKAGGRPQRSSREAIDSLFPSDSGGKAADKVSPRTPDDLKNPFVDP